MGTREHASGTPGSRFRAQPRPAASSGSLDRVREELAVDPLLWIRRGGLAMAAIALVGGLNLALNPPALQRFLGPHP